MGKLRIKNCSVWKILMKFKEEENLISNLKLFFFFRTFWRISFKKSSTKLKLPGFLSVSECFRKFDTKFDGNFVKISLFHHAFCWVVK
jgi:hypothetical protein